MQAEHARGLIANAVLIGVDLGPNLSVTGSLATILWLIALRKEKLDVSGWDFLKVGAIAMPRWPPGRRHSDAAAANLCTQMLAPRCLGI